MFEKAKQPKSGEFFEMTYKDFQKKFKGKCVLGKEYDFGKYKANVVLRGEEKIKFLVK